MSFRHEITFKCDSCDTNFTIDEQAMELPPGWLGLQIAVADSDGCIPEQEREVFGHFCTRACLVEYISSQQIMERLCLTDKKIDDPFENDEEE